MMTTTYAFSLRNSPLMNSDRRRDVFFLVVKNSLKLFDEWAGAGEITAACCCTTADEGGVVVVWTIGIFGSSTVKNFGAALDSPLLLLLINIADMNVVNLVESELSLLIFLMGNAAPASLTGVAAAAVVTTTFGECPATMVAAAFPEILDSTSNEFDLYIEDLSIDGSNLLIFA